MEDLKQHLITMHRLYPNNMELGTQVRRLVWSWLEEQSKAIKDEQLPGQLDMFDNTPQY